ncbi:hypothetical protein F5Y13DRAFT_150413 [Hypoxylon sp. FL1857]|nr:hypothetical protein F5Y13DRAFT_150413 [Hypoxylon sp. FL1857]
MYQKWFSDSSAILLVLLVILNLDMVWTIRLFVLEFGISDGQRMAKRSSASRQPRPLFAQIIGEHFHQGTMAMTISLSNQPE